jgi:hypothetical protein
MEMTSWQDSYYYAFFEMFVSREKSMKYVILKATALAMFNVC